MEGRAQKTLSVPLSPCCSAGAGLVVILHLGPYSRCWHGAFIQELQRSFNRAICISSTHPAVVKRDALLSCELFPPFASDAAWTAEREWAATTVLAPSLLWPLAWWDLPQKNNLSCLPSLCSPCFLKNSWIQPLVRISPLRRDAANNEAPSVLKVYSLSPRQLLFEVNMRSFTCHLLTSYACV